MLSSPRHRSLSILAGVGLVVGTLGLMPDHAAGEAVVFASESNVSNTSSLFGYQLQIDADDRFGFNAPRVQLTPITTSNARLTYFRMTIGDTTFNYDSVFNLRGFGNAGTTITQGDTTNNGRRTNGLIFTFDDFDSGETIAFNADIDRDINPDIPAPPNVLVNNGNRDNLEIEARFSDGLNVFRLQNTLADRTYNLADGLTITGIRQFDSSLTDINDPDLFGIGGFFFNDPDFGVARNTGDDRFFGGGFPAGSPVADPPADLGGFGVPPLGGPVTTPRDTIINPTPTAALGGAAMLGLMLRRRR